MKKWKDLTDEERWKGIKNTLTGLLIPEAIKWLTVRIEPVHPSPQEEVPARIAQLLLQGGLVKEDQQTWKDDWHDSFLKEFTEGDG